MRVLLLALVLLAAPAAAAELKIATWNLEWLTNRPAGDPALPEDVVRRADGDFARLAAYAARLRADVVAFQEVDGPAAAARVFDPATYVLHFPAEDDVQRAGFAVRRGLRFTANPDLAGLDLRPTAAHSLRRGADVTIEWAGGALRLLSIHLHAGCSSGRLEAPDSPPCADLARQVPVLAGWVAERAAEGVAFAILGDFNRRMGAAAEGARPVPPDVLLRTLRVAAPLLRTTEGYSNPCWGGSAFIDHLLLGGPARGWLVPASLRVMVYAERDEADRARLSDHCPVSVRLRLP